MSISTVLIKRTKNPFFSDTLNLKLCVQDVESFPTLWWNSTVYF